MKKLLILLLLPLFLNGQTIINLYSDEISVYSPGSVLNVFGNYPVYNTDAQAVFDRISVWLTPTEKSLDSRFVDSLQLYYIWDSTNAVYVTAAKTAQAANLNWKGDIYNLVPVSSPIFSPYFGYTGTGSSYLNTTFNPSLSTEHFSRNSGLFVVRTDSMGGTGGAHGVDVGGVGVCIFPNNGGLAASKLNAASGASHANVLMNKTFVANRTISTEHELYIDKDKYTGVHNSYAPSNNNIYILAYNASGTTIYYSTNNVSFAMIGGGLTQAQIEKLIDILDWYIPAKQALEVGAFAYENVLSPSLPSYLNTYFLQKALDGGFCTIELSPGTYNLNSTLFLDSYTTITAPGVIFKKDAAYSNVFLNRGALTKEFNTDIELNGFTIDVNSKEKLPDHVYGLRGHLGFFFIKNLTIKNVSIPNIGTAQFGIQMGKWENIVLDSIILKGMKDGLDFFCGHGATISNVRDSTYDDACFIGGIGYPSAQMEAMGDIYDMTFTHFNYVDSAKVFPARAFMMYLGSWADWAIDNTYRTGDFCLNESKLYQCSNSNGFSGTGANAPVHTTGLVTGADGIQWHFVDTGNIYSTNIYNITIDSSLLYNPSVAICYSAEDNEYTRNIYPGTEDLARSWNIVVKNTTISNTRAVYHKTGLTDVTFENCIMDSMVWFVNSVVNNDTEDSLGVRSLNNIFSNFDDFINVESSRVVLDSDGDAYVNCAFDNAVSGTGILRANNLTLPFSTLTNITPLIGDTCMSVGGIYRWNGEWILIE